MAHDVGQPVDRATRSVTFDLSEADLLAFMRWYYRSPDIGRIYLVYLVGGVLLPALPLLIVCLLDRPPRPLAWAAVGVTACVWIAIWAASRAAQPRQALARTLTPTGRRRFLGTFTMAIGPDRLLVEGPIGRGWVSWSAVESIEITATHALFLLGGHQAHVLPRHGFAGPEAFGEFVDQACKFWQAASVPDESVCPRCGYDLSAQRTAGCPECGWRRGAGTGTGTGTGAGMGTGRGAGAGMGTGTGTVPPAATERS